MSTLVFDKIRLVGFKSFVEPTDFIIERGLTGIVGPNGCGKSNLLEAIRWVMGANSAKAMRASGMDDVIFNGTSHRPARNQAHVTLTIDNSARIAPAQFNDMDTLEVTRLITKGGGSKYQVNGKTVRAKDVQLLFADASTGANSPALVRQGQIDKLINAKPSNRRMILEEAAGISGLHTRRHEAELRLRAAETNLSRLDDVIGQIEGQLLSLRRQSRQAARYKRLAGEIREYKALLWLRRWQHALKVLSETQETLQACETRVQDAVKEEAEKTRIAAEMAEALEPKREEQLVAAAILARLNEAKDQLQRDEDAAQDELEDLKSRLDNIDTDMSRENGMIEDADRALGRLAIEQDTLAGLEDMSAALEAAEAAAQTALQARDTIEREYDELTRNMALATAARDSHKSELGRFVKRQSQLSEEQERIKERYADIKAKAISGGSGDLFETAATDALQALEAARARIPTLEAARQETEARVQARREDLSALKQTLSELKAEQTAITNFLSRGAVDAWVPVMEDLNVVPGYEVALAVALGDDLHGGLDTEASLRWTGADTPAQALPHGVTALSEFVTAPDALAPRLSQIGVSESDEVAAHIPALAPGQRIVSLGGALARWDGFVMDAGLETAAAARLAQQNRLDSIKAQLEQVTEQLSQAQSEYDTVKTEQQEAVTTLKAARETLNICDREERAARSVLAQFETEQARSNAEVRSIEERQTRITHELTELESMIASTQTSLDKAVAALDTDMMAQQTDLKSKLVNARSEADEANATFRSLRNESQARQQRLNAIAQEIADWSSRSDTAKRHLETLASRRTQADGALRAAIDGPDRFAERRQTLLHELSQAEDRRKLAADVLAEAENQLRAAVDVARTAEAAHSKAREDRAAADARLQAAQERVEETQLRISENLSCEPQDLGNHLGELDPDSALAESEIERKLERLNNERERMGGVNLRADVEMQEQEERLTSMNEERGDLIAAIARLREGIDELNSEGRKRLLEAFDVVNGHFGRLFTTLFGGGEAALTLTESDDPLEAGLEVMASPPGKKLGSMSLMSGGEQALTATALIFAVFLSNPAPICVLDEVDAPLDDANVARYCNLLDAMKQQTNTKFIAITHNAVTMSRMDRLFGVTMAEQGVSQLVSMELSGATQLIAAE